MRKVKGACMTMYDQQQLVCLVTWSSAEGFL